MGLYYFDNISFTIQALTPNSRNTDLVIYYKNSSFLGHYLRILASNYRHRKKVKKTVFFLDNL
jgi:hypothetical protein